MCPALTSIPKKLRAHSLSALLTNLKYALVSQIATLLQWPLPKKGILKSRNGSVMANLKDYAPVILNGKVYTQTIRTVKCELLLNGDNSKCRSCKTYRATLRTLYNRWSHRSSDNISDTSSHTNIRYMSSPEKNTSFKKGPN